MIKRFLFLTLLVPALSSLHAQPGYWVPKAPFAGGARTACTSFALGSGACVGMGLDSTDTRRSFYSYNPLTDSWTQLASLGGVTGAGLGRDVAMGFSIGIKGYVVGGQGSNPFFNDNWEYDPGGDTWGQKMNLTPGGRRSAASFAVNNKGYVCCGQDAVGLKNDLWEYDPTTNTWAQKANFTGTARRLPVAFVANGKVYVGTGDDGTFKKDFYQYNPSNNTWSAVTNFGGTPRYGAIGFSINNKGYVGLGYDNTLNNTSDIWEYNTTSNSWSPMQPFPGTPRSNAVAVACTNNKAYIGTGYDGLPREDWWELDPLINSVQEVSSLHYSSSVYPNPVVDKAMIDLDPKIFQLYREVTIEVYDLNGKKIRSISGVKNEKTVFDRESLGSGVYVYTVVAGNGMLASGRMLLE